MESAANKTKSVAIIGAGPNGYALGIRLLQQGHAITLFEAENSVGQGISARPDCNPFAVMHSGAFYPKGSNAATTAFATYDWLGNAPQNDPLHPIYQQHSFSSGKLIVARSERGVDTLRILTENLRDSGIPHQLHEDKDSLSRLDEASIGPAESISAALELPTVRAINIKGYLNGLKEAYERMGGNTSFSHPVSDIAFTRRQGERIALVTSTREVYRFDAVVNMAGIHGAALCRNAEANAAKLQIEHPKTPEVSFFSYGVLRRKPDRAIGQPISKRVVYSAENASLPSVGTHSYLSKPAGSEGYEITLGPFYFPASLEQILTRNIPSTTITPDIDIQAKRVFPDFKPDDYELVPVGYIVRQPNRELNTLTCRHGDALLVHGFVSDSPGLTVTPITSQRIADMVSEHFNMVEQAKIRR